MIKKIQLDNGNYIANTVIYNKNGEVVVDLYHFVKVFDIDLQNLNEEQTIELINRFCEVYRRGAMYVQDGIRKKFLDFFEINY